MENPSTNTAPLNEAEPTRTKLLGKCRAFIRFFNDYDINQDKVSPEAAAGDINGYLKKYFGDGKQLETALDKLIKRAEQEFASDDKTLYEIFGGKLIYDSERPSDYEFDLAKELADAKKLPGTYLEKRPLNEKFLVIPGSSNYYDKTEDLISNVFRFEGIYDEI